MNTITLDNSTYNDVATFARYNNISVAEAVKAGLKMLLEQFKVKNNPQRVRLQDRVEEIEALPENWDYNNAPAISKDACDFSRKVLASCDDALLSGLAIFPNTNGKVLMQWKTLRGDACLSILENEFAYDVNSCDGEVSGVLPFSQVHTFLDELKSIE